MIAPLDSHAAGQALVWLVAVVALVAIAARLIGRRRADVPVPDLSLDGVPATAPEGALLADFSGDAGRMLQELRDHFASGNDAVAFPVSGSFAATGRYVGRPDRVRGQCVVVVTDGTRVRAERTGRERAARPTPRDFAVEFEGVLDREAGRVVGRLHSRAPHITGLRDGGRAVSMWLAMDAHRIAQALLDAGSGASDG